MFRWSKKSDAVIVTLDPRSEFYYENQKKTAKVVALFATFKLSFKNTVECQ
jgi:hypothetical protein